MCHHIIFLYMNKESSPQLLAEGNKILDSTRSRLSLGF